MKYRKPEAESINEFQTPEVQKALRLSRELSAYCQESGCW